MQTTIATNDNQGKTELNYVILMSSKAKLLQMDAGKQFIEP